MIEDTKNELCDRIRDRIRELGLTQVEAANLTGLRQSIISNMVNSKTEYGVEGLQRTLERLGVYTEVKVRVTKVEEPLLKSLR